MSLFLVEYRPNHFVNAHRIEIIGMDRHSVYFCLIGEENEFFVEEGCRSLFLNHVQAINQNINNVQIKLGAVE